MSSKSMTMMPLVSKLYCSGSQVELVVRRRPHVVNGGGFVVTDSSQKLAFTVDGCGILGSKDMLILRDGLGDALLLIRHKRGMVEALSIYKKWRGYRLDFEESEELVFSLKEPKSCLVKKKGIRIRIKLPSGIKNMKENGDFEIKGYFPDRDCSIVDSSGNVAAQIGVKKEVMKGSSSKDVYYVRVEPGFDQAFVFGVLAILDNIYGESTTC